MAEVLGMQSVRKGPTLALADVFANDSDNEQTFYGFSDNDISDHGNKSSQFEQEDEAQLDISSKKEKSTSKKPTGARSFSLRVALRSASSTQQPIEEKEVEEEEEEGMDDAEEEEQKPKKRGVKRARDISQAKKMRRVKFEDECEETAVARPSPSKECGSDSEEDEAKSFLVKRQENIKANKAMLAQLMADLQKMPGGAGLLKKQAGKLKAKERSSRPPRSGVGGELRKNPDRASRRQTRSMGAVDDSTPKEEEVELSLEEELVEVRRAPRRRGAPRPNQSKPHLIRPVDDITEDEIELVADNMTDKVYNSVTGSTCHQCRQKTVDTKTCCRSEDCRGIQGQFCGPCLRNRYGEDVRKALLDPEWKCPPCRGICNCSFCRARDGRCPTGILFPLAQYHGFSDVHSYLTSLRNKLKNEDNDEET